MAAPKTATSLLSRAAILDAQDLPTKDVPVPEWGGTVRIRSMTASDRDTFDQSMVAAKIAADQSGDDFRPDHVRAAYAASCIVDADGASLFSVEDIEALKRKSAAAMDRVYQAVLSLNGLSDDAIEEAGKN